MNTIDLQITNAQEELQAIRNQLINEMHSLASRLHYEADCLLDDPDCNPNSLGEVQGAGPSIDILCVRFSMKKKEIARLEAMKKKMENAS